MGPNLGYLGTARQNNAQPPFIGLTPIDIISLLKGSVTGLALAKEFLHFRRRQPPKEGGLQKKCPGLFPLLPGVSW